LNIKEKHLEISQKIKYRFNARFCMRRSNLSVVSARLNLTFCVSKQPVLEEGRERTQELKDSAIDH